MDKEIREYMTVEVDPESNLQYLITTNRNVWDDFLFHYPCKEYNWGARKYITVIREDSLGYDWNETSFKLGRGYAIYILNKFSSILDEQSIKLLNHDIYSDVEINDNDLDGLYDYQKDTVRELFSHRRCIAQIPTSSGKTEMIGKITQKFINEGKTVLITVGLSKVVDEIKERVHKFLPDLYIPDYYDDEAQINVINPKGFARSDTFNPDDPFLHNVDVVLCDEVSSSTNDSTWAVFIQVHNEDCLWYGFDATAENVNADQIDIRENLDCINSEETTYVIALFGMSWIFSRPTDYRVDIIEITSIGLREISKDMIKESFSETSIYRDITNFIFSHPEYLRSLEYVMKTYGRLFIPINNLDYIENIVDHFKDDYSIITITGSGYWSSIEGDIDLPRLKFLTEENKVDLVLSTAAGFKGLDFRGIPNILLTLGQKAGQVIQFVGRVARQKHFRVIVITPGGNWKLPIYTRNNIRCLELIESYYRLCNLNYIEDKYE